MVQIKCSSCESRFLEGELQYCSSIFGAVGVILCRSCSDTEEHMIEEKGTNDIPELLLIYKNEIFKSNI